VLTSLPPPLDRHRAADSHEARRDQVKRFLTLIRRHLGMDVAFVGEFRGDMRVFQWVDSAVADCPIAVGGGDPLEDSYCLRVVDGRLPGLIHNAPALPEAAALAVTHTLPVGAHLSVPIVLPDGRLYGTFCCFSSRPDHSLGDRELEAMRMVAALISEMVAHEATESAERDALAARIQAVLATGGPRMVFQPIVDLHNGQPVGYEALARFDTPDPPDVWFARAADVDLGVSLELAAVRAALAQLPEAPDGCYVAVNLSPAALTSDRLLDALAETVPARVVLELTEHVSDADHIMAEPVRELRNRGFRLAVDDTGAGYASLNRLLQLRPEIVKLDRDLTRRIADDQARQALAWAIASFVDATGSVLVAEGIETAEDLHALESLGVVFGQGYHLGRPVALPQAR